MRRWIISFAIMLLVVAVSPIYAHSPHERHFNIGNVSYSWECNNFTLDHSDTFSDWRDWSEGRWEC